MKILVVVPVPEEKKKLFMHENTEIVYKDRQKITPDDLQDVDAVLGNLPYELINTSSSIRWIQLDSAGVGSLARLRNDILVTNASGAYGEAISEHMLAVTLAIMKNIYRYYDRQKFHEWNNLGSVKTIAGCTVLSIGMGDIGSAYAMRMHLLGAKVIGVRRTIHDQPDYVDGLYTADSLDTLLPEADIVALSLPETESTRHILNQERISLMKTGAILINVGRGSAIDQDALRNAMISHKLAGAALDVTEKEPLPKNDPLWNTPGVYITPHISGRFNARATYDKVLDIMTLNLDRFCSGQPLEHVVDRKKGY